MADNSVYHFLVTTDPSWENRGYSKQLANMTVCVAKDDGYLFVVADATNKISQHILVKHLGYEILGFHMYDSFEFQGSRPFAGLKDSLGVMRVVKTLD